VRCLHVAYEAMWKEATGVGAADRKPSVNEVREPLARSQDMVVQHSAADPIGCSGAGAGSATGDIGSPLALAVSSRY
jgi:hypothetical protein